MRTCHQQHRAGYTPSFGIQIGLDGLAMRPTINFFECCMIGPLE